MLKTDQTNFLFSGCSHTFGEGLPEKYLWPTLFMDKVKNDNTNFYNIGAMGGSTRLIVKNVLSFIRVYGSPDFIFLMMPDLHRDLQFHPETNKMINCFPHTMWLTSKEHKVQQKFTMNYSPEYTIFTNTEYLRMLEDICSAKKIKLLWSTWSSESDSVYSQLNFKNYVNKDNVVEYSRNTKSEPNWRTPFYENLNNLPYWKIAQDDNHFGTFWTTHVADLFYSRAKELGYEI
jgi:hypothetical protein